jgi:hypothetical protein
VLIDVTIPGDRHVIKKEAEKILKYKGLVIEIQRMCNVKSNVTPVIIVATGTISKSFRKYLSSIPGNAISRNCRKQLYWVHHTYPRNMVCFRYINVNILHKGDDDDDDDNI